MYECGCSRGDKIKFDDLTPEQQERVRACKTPEELHALAKEVGAKLTDEQLDAIAGGTWDCPYLYCGSYEICNGFTWDAWE